MGKKIEKHDPVLVTRELLTTATPGPWFDWDEGEWLHEPKSLLSHEDDAALIARAPELLRQLADEVERLRRVVNIPPNERSVCDCHTWPTVSEMHDYVVALERKVLRPPQT